MTKLRLILVALLVVFVGACSSSNVGMRELDKNGEYQTLLKSNNSLLKSRLQIAELNERMAGDIMQVQATLENGWKFELDFQYKIKFFDASNFELAPESQSWRQLIMAGRTQANVQAVAPNPSAVKYEIWVRE